MTYAIPETAATQSIQFDLKIMIYNILILRVRQPQKSYRMNLAVLRYNYMPVPICRHIRLDDVSWCRDVKFCMSKSVPDSNQDNESLSYSGIIATVKESEYINPVTIRRNRPNCRYYRPVTWRHAGVTTQSQINPFINDLHTNYWWQCDFLALRKQIQ